MPNYEETVFVEKEISVSADKAWDIIALPGNLTLWHRLKGSLDLLHWF